MLNIKVTKYRVNCRVKNYKEKFLKIRLDILFANKYVIDLDMVKICVVFGNFLIRVY